MWDRQPSPRLAPSHDYRPNPWRDPDLRPDPATGVPLSSARPVVGSRWRTIRRVIVQVPELRAVDGGRDPT